MERPDFPYDHYVHKTITRLSRVGQPYNWKTWGDGVVNKIGLSNPGVEKFVDSVAPAIRRDFVASIYGSSDLEWGVLAEAVGQLSNVEAIEVNFSCPNIDKEGHMTRGEMEDALGLIVHKTDRPIYVKLGPHHGVYDALTCQNFGASKIVCCNTLPTPLGGFSGPPIQSLVIELIESLVATETFHTPIVGIGGIQGPRDHEGIGKFLDAGATDVGIGSWHILDLEG